MAVVVSKDYRTIVQMATDRLASLCILLYALIAVSIYPAVVQPKAILLRTYRIR